MEEAEFVNSDPVLRLPQTHKYFEAKRRVLILEDDRLLGQIIAMILEDIGFEVVLVNNSITVFAQLQQPPDLIILDVLLMEATGFEICSSLRVNPVTKDIPLLVITSRLDGKSIKQAVQLGIRHSLLKPFTEDELLWQVIPLLMNGKENDAQELPAYRWLLSSVRLF